MIVHHGNLLEVDDGGIYVRTGPQTNLGDWLALNGNLQVGEIATSRLIAIRHDPGRLAGQRKLPAAPADGLAYQIRRGGDGVSVAVDDQSLAGAGQTLRYYTAQRLQASRATPTTRAPARSPPPYCRRSRAGRGERLHTLVATRWPRRCPARCRW